MFIGAAVAMIVAMLLALIRAFAGPTLYDRVLAGNSFGTKTVLLIAVMGFVFGRPDFLDIALVYALINFTGTIAILKFFRYRTLSVSLDDENDPSTVVGAQYLMPTSIPVSRPELAGDGIAGSVAQTQTSREAG